MLDVGIDSSEASNEIVSCMSIGEVLPSDWGKYLDVTIYLGFIFTVFPFGDAVHEGAIDKIRRDRTHAQCGFRELRRDCSYLKITISNFIRHEIIQPSKLTYYYPLQFPPPQEGVSAVLWQVRLERDCTGFLHICSGA